MTESIDAQNQDIAQYLVRLSQKKIDLSDQSFARIQIGLDWINLQTHGSLNTHAHKIILVGGTNGKGTTVAMLEALSVSAGLSVGSFTSPHLLQFHERIKINQTLIAHCDCIRLFEKLSDFLLEQPEIYFTQFEIIFLLAVLYFSEYSQTKKQKFDLLIFEVGLGGRLDAVNSLEPDLSVITSLGFDHEAWLGQTLGEISFEKSGILRSKKPFVCGIRNILPSSLQNSIQKYQVPVFQLGQSFDAIWTRADRSQWIFKNDFYNFEEINNLKLNLEYDFQCDIKLSNFAIAIQSFLLLFGQDKLRSIRLLERAIQKFKLIGRQVCIQKNGVSWILDVAHNPSSVQSFFKFLEQQIVSHLKKNPDARFYSILGGCRDKNWSAMLQEMPKQIREKMRGCFTLTLEQTDRSWEANNLAKLIALNNYSGTKIMLRGFSNVKDLQIDLQKYLKPGDYVISYGSFYLIEKIIKNLS